MSFLSSHMIDTVLLRNLWKQLDRCWVGVPIAMTHYTAPNNTDQVQGSMVTVFLATCRLLFIVQGLTLYKTKQRYAMKSRLHSYMSTCSDRGCSCARVGYKRKHLKLIH